jgi:kanamycin nucleotidyltransferase
MKRFGSGPLPQSSAARRARLDEFLVRLNNQYGPRLLLAALYGSMARGEDGPHSDIELFCVLEEPGLDESLEWIYGPGKAEINLLGPDVARREASRVEENWSLSSGQFTGAQLLYGDAGLLEELRQRALSVSHESRQAAVASIVVGELYEWIGKLRNAAGTDLPLAPLACDFTVVLAQAVGLANGRRYSSSMRQLSEVLTFPDLPDGFSELCQLVAAGDLRDPARVSQAIENAWSGLEPWLARLGISIPVESWPGQQPAPDAEL